MKYLMLLFLLPVMIPAGTADPGISVRNSHFSVRLDDPALSDPNGTFGCRFLRAGWITALYPQGSRENLFHPVSISRYHKAFGCALEILPPLRLTPDRQLKLGIGIVEPHPVSRFQAKPIELFPWQTAIDESAGQTVLTARQSSGNHNGYAYELTVTICIPVSTPEIIWRLDLHNTGSRKLDLLSYLHPFFRFRTQQSCKFRLSGKDFRNVFQTRPNTREEYSARPRVYEISARFRTDTGHTVILGAGQPLTQSVIWHNGKDCFALEPFIALNIPPGERRSWNFRMSVRQDSAFSENHD